MAKRGGFPGARGGFPGGGNMNNLIKQAQKMQQEMANVQQELEAKVFEATVGGGAISAKVSGKKELLEINLKPEVVDPDDIEMLQDLIISAVNEAIRKADEASNSEMGKLTGGLGGMF